MPIWIISFGQWIFKLISGWIPIGDTPLREWIGKILWVIGIVTLCLIVYHKFTESTNRTIISGDGKQINIYDDTPKQDLFSFGCSNLKVDMYWKLHRKSK